MVRSYKSEICLYQEVGGVGSCQTCWTTDHVSFSVKLSHVMSCASSFGEFPREFLAQVSDIF